MTRRPKKPRASAELLPVSRTPRNGVSWGRRLVMARRIFSREFKVEAVRLVKDRSVTVAQACRDPDVHENVLRRWIREPSQSQRQSRTSRSTNSDFTSTAKPKLL
jgi:transposase-like protein